MKINAADIADGSVDDIIAKAEAMVAEADKAEQEILAIVNEKISSK